MLADVVGATARSFGWPRASVSLPGRASILDIAATPHSHGNGPLPCSGTTPTVLTSLFAALVAADLQLLVVMLG